MQQPLEIAIACSKHVVQALVVILYVSGMEHLDALLSHVLVRLYEVLSGGGGSLYLGLSLLSGVTACDTEEIGKIRAVRGAPQGAGCIAF